MAKRIGTALLVLYTLFTLCSCTKQNVRNIDTYVREDNELYSDELYSDEHYEYSYGGMRTYDMSHVVSDQNILYGYMGQPLSEMKRFVFTRNTLLSKGDAGFSFMLDTRSRRIYSGHARGISNAYTCQWVVDLKKEDIDNLIEILESVNIHSWKSNLGHRQKCEYAVGIEYVDGSLEVCYVETYGSSIRKLEKYLENEVESFKERMLQDRKVTPNIDYLIAYLGWDPSSNSDRMGEYDINRIRPLVAPPKVTLESVERIVVFEADEPYGIMDHSRNSQKTLFWDVLKGKLYYEPERAVYEQIHKASVIRSLEDWEAERIISLLADGVTGWNANELYLSRDKTGLFTCNTDIPAWCIGIQYVDGTIVHYSGDGIYDDGWAPGSRDLLDRLFTALPLD